MQNAFFIRKKAWQILTGLLMILLCSLPLQAQDHDATLKVATYNVQWFLDTHPDPYSRTLPRVYPKSKEKILQIMQVIREMNADVVSFQEIENHGILQEVVNEYLPDMGYKYIVVGHTNSDVGQQIGVISRKPILSSTSYRYVELTIPGDDRTWRFARDLLKVTIQASAEKTLDIYTVHFKSKRDGPGDKNSNAWRLAESLKSREIITDHLSREPEAWIILAGDFNDTPDSPTLQTLIGGGTQLLYDPHAWISSEKRISYLRNPYRSIIDFTLLSPSLRSRVIKAGTNVFVYEMQDPTSIEGSDHSPVVVTLDLKQ